MKKGRRGIGGGNVRGMPRLENRETWRTRRFNNRKNPFLFRDTMLKLIHSENLEYKELTKVA
jgi:hypothetical protein